MEKSESIGKLAEALAKAQGAIEGAKKDSQNPFFKSTYADLASVWDAVRKPLSDNGLAIIQVPLVGLNDDVLLQTVLTHSSGEWVSGIMSMKPTKHDPQGVGSVLSYLRRYCMSAFLGVAQVDDDANAASQKPFESKATVTKVVDLHPGQPKDVDTKLGDEPPASTIEEEAAKTDLRNKIMAAGKGITKKVDFLRFVGGEVKSVDALQEVLDNIDKYKMDFINSQAKDYRK